MEFCDDNHCVDCCKDAVVPLLNEDINKIVMHGYYDVYFVNEQDGIKKLRTRPDGSCIFHNTQDYSCDIYSTRPERCKLNPYCLSEKTHKTTIDHACRHARGCNDDPEMHNKMHEYISTLQKEVEWRRRTGFF